MQSNKDLHSPKKKKKKKSNKDLHNCKNEKERFCGNCDMIQYCLSYQTGKITINLVKCKAV